MKKYCLLCSRRLKVNLQPCLNSSSIMVKVTAADGHILYARLKTWQLSKEQAEEIEK